MGYCLLRLLPRTRESWQADVTIHPIRTTVRKGALLNWVLRKYRPQISLGQKF